MKISKSRQRAGSLLGAVVTLALIVGIMAQFAAQTFAVTSSTEAAPNFVSRSWHVDFVNGELTAGANGVIYVVSGTDIVVFDSNQASTSGSTNPTYLKTWTGFSGVEDVVYKNGDIYVAVSGGTVYRFSSSLAGGNVVGYATAWTGLGSGVTSMDFDGNDTIAVARGNNVEVFHPSELPSGGAPTITSWAYTGLYLVTLDDSGNVYAAAYADHTIKRWPVSDTNPTPTYTATWTGVSSAFTNGLRYVDNYLYVGQKSVGASGDWYRIPANLASGDISSDPARQSMGGGTDPEGITADASGNVYAANWSVSTIQKFVVPQNLANLTHSGKDIHVELPSNANIMAHAVAGQSVTDGAYKYPLGLIDFDFETATAGQSTDVTIYFQTGLKPSDVVARKFDSGSQTYSNIPGAVVTQSTWGGKPALKLEYNITDGGTGDEDGLQNALVSDPVSLATTDDPATVTTGVADGISETSATIHGTVAFRNDMGLTDVINDHDVNDYGLYIFTTHSTLQPLDWHNDTWTTAQTADFVQDGSDPQLYTFTNHLTGLTCGTTYYYQNSWEQYTSISDDWAWSTNPGSSFTTAACGSAALLAGVPNTGLFRGSTAMQGLIAVGGVICLLGVAVYLVRTRKRS